MNVYGDVVLVAYGVDLPLGTPGSAGSGGRASSISPQASDLKLARKGTPPRTSPRESPRGTAMRGAAA